MKLTREEVPKGAIKRLMDWRDGVEGENDDFGYCAGNKAFGDDVIEALAALLQAQASNECGSVPDEPSEDESIIACLRDDAAKLMQANPGDEMATTMLVAAIRIEQLLSRMQQPNNQPNSDHLAVTSAEPESRLTDAAVWISETLIRDEWVNHVNTDPSIHHWPEVLAFARRIAVISANKGYRTALQSGINPKSSRPNEQDVVGQEGKQ